MVINSTFQFEKSKVHFVATSKSAHFESDPHLMQRPVLHPQNFPRKDHGHTLTTDWRTDWTVTAQLKLSDWFRKVFPTLLIFPSVRQSSSSSSSYSPFWHFPTWPWIWVSTAIKSIPSHIPAFRRKRGDQSYKLVLIKTEIHGPPPARGNKNVKWALVNHSDHFLIPGTTNEEPSFLVPSVDWMLCRPPVATINRDRVRCY